MTSKIKWKRYRNYWTSRYSNQQVYSRQLLDLDLTLHLTLWQVSLTSFYSPPLPFLFIHCQRRSIISSGKKLSYGFFESLFHILFFTETVVSTARVRKEFDKFLLQITKEFDKPDSLASVRLISNCSSRSDDNHATSTADRPVWNVNCRWD